MVELEAVIEVLLDLTNFYNIDLKYSGYYQIRAQLRSSKRQPCKAEISIQRSTAPHLFPASVVNGQAVGATFEILYQTEEIILEDSILFKAFVPFDVHKVPKVIPINLILELWFIDKDELLQKTVDDAHSAYKCISKRSININVPIFRGLYYRRPILFDYFHLSALVSTIYASLVGLNAQPLIDRPHPNGPSLPVEEAFFRNFKLGDQRLQQAYSFHRNLCWLLLTAYEALELKFTQFIEYLPKQCQIRIQSVDCAKKFEILQQNLQRVTDETELARSILNINKLLSSELSLLWRQFLDLFKRQSTINKCLSTEHHNSRIRRFGESFLCYENSTSNLLSDISGQSLRTQEKLVENLRKSQYFQRVPVLPVSCDVLDGCPDLTPVIVEERYQPTRKRPSLPFIDHSSNSVPTFSIYSTHNEESLTKNSSFCSTSYNNSAHDRLKNSLRLNFDRVFTPNCVEDNINEPQSTKSESVSNDNLSIGEKKIKTNKLNRKRSNSLSQLEQPDESLIGTTILGLRSQSQEPIYETYQSISPRTTDANSASELDDASLKFIDRTDSGQDLINCDIIKSTDSPILSERGHSPTPARLTSGVDEELLQFIGHKETFKQKLKDVSFDGYLYSDCSAYPSKAPYFGNYSTGCNKKRVLTDIKSFFHLNTLKVDFHLIVCVHGLEGTWADLKMVRSYLDLALRAESCNTNFLMSRRNQITTFDDFEAMSKNLVDEILLYLSQCNSQPSRISFIGHSLGNIIIRSALCDPRLEPLLERLHTFLSLNGPHCGILYNSSVVNMGIKLIQRWKKSMSLQQLALKDHIDLRECFLFKLSLKPCLQYFKNVLLVGSFDDHYVPIHSALIEFCRASSRDQSILGTVYSEMVQNLMQPLSTLSCSTVVRYSVYHSPQASSTASQWIGKAAHVAVLDSDLFIEKLVTVSALKYFV